MFNVETIKILLVFFPGIVGFIFIHYAISTYKKIDVTLGLLFSFVLGVISYLSIPIFSKFCFLSSFFETNGNLLEMNFSEKDILLALILSIIYSIIVIKIIDKEFFHFLLRKINVSKTVGTKHILRTLYTTTDEYLLKLKSNCVDIRFKNKDLTYTGTVRLIGVHDNGLVEILLENAGAIYDNKPDFSYTVKSVVICEKLENIILEYRNQ